jgi:uncharacterized protein (TIGR04255 family)
MSRKYQSPPVIEAYCEIIFPDSSLLDPTIPGLLYSVPAIHTKFPLREQRIIQERQVISEANKPIREETTISTRAVFLSNDRNSMVQIASNLLAINYLKPYPGWSVFLPMIEDVFGTLQGQAAEIRIERTALHFTNIIEVPNPEQVVLSQYLNLRPFMGVGFPTLMNAFQVDCDFPFNDGKDGCRVHLGSTAVNPAGKQAILLDLHYYSAAPGQVDSSNLVTWFTSAHTEVEKLFEYSITDEARVLFLEVR